MNQHVTNQHPNSRRIDSRSHPVSVVTRPARFYSALPDTIQTVFMQDGASPHIAQEAQQWRQENFPGFWGRGVWPGHNMDLNPIENLWAILQNITKITPATRR